MGLTRKRLVSTTRAKLKLCSAESYFVHGSLLHFMLTNFPLPISAVLFATSPQAVIFTRISALFGSFLLRLVEIIFDALKLQSSVNVVMEKLQIDGQSIKFVDRKLWKRDSIEGKLNFEGKFYLPTWSTGPDREREGKSGGVEIKKKCPTVIELPRKRRILKRPKRFKNYYSDREPLEIPSFSFPRC